MTVPVSRIRVADVGNVNFDTTVLPGGQWFLLDTYPLTATSTSFFITAPAGSLCRWPS